MNSWINPGRMAEVSGRFWILNFEKYNTRSPISSGLFPFGWFCVLDERPDSINDGWFMVSMESFNPNDLAGLQVRDLPAFIITGEFLHLCRRPRGILSLAGWRTLAMKFVKNGQPAPNNQDVLC